MTGTITITDALLFFYIARRHWKTPLWILIPGAAFLLTVDLLFLAANLTKFTHGASLRIHAVALVFFTVLTTWQKGEELVTKAREEEEGQLQSFVDKLHAMDPPLLRVPGTAIFLDARTGRRRSRCGRRSGAQQSPARERADPRARDEARPARPATSSGSR